jgi:hypothetical protein
MGHTMVARILAFPNWLNLGMGNGTTRHNRIRYMPTTPHQ